MRHGNKSVSKSIAFVLGIGMALGEKKKTSAIQTGVKESESYRAS